MMQKLNNQSITHIETCVAFLKNISIPVIKAPTGGNDFLPGLEIKNGSIILYEANLQYPGDILHEAGHIAVVPSSERASLTAETIIKRENREAEEMMAIAWSYAACIHLHFDPFFVFHEAGYKGGGVSIVSNFKEKRYLGLPMLQWVGMAADEENVAEKNIAPYPSMIKWLRD